MKRFTGVRVLTQALLECDVAVFIGEDICKEAFPYVNKSSSLFFSDEQDYLISMALGMAMCTSKRVFVFCEDQYIVRNFSEVINAGVSSCKNFIIVLFLHGRYTVIDNAPIALSSSNCQAGVFFNMNFMLDNYTKYFEVYKNPLPKIKEAWDKISGPLVVFLEPEKGTKKLPEISFSSKEDLFEVQKFILDDTLQGHNFVPPISLEDLNLEV